MRVAIVHYHLEPGGVTSVIRSASRAFTAAGIDHVILIGGPVTDSRPFPVHHIDGLGYLADPGSLTAETLRAAATEALGGPPDLWHFHNHSLGKNRLLPEIVSQLAHAGERLVLQIHDLCENGRPANYPLIAGSSKLYPVSPRIRYAFLNPHDLEIFTAAGLPAANGGLLINPVSSYEPTPASATTIVFAPIRGIRRKNIGELVCLAALSPAGTWFAVSRAPLNPAALPVHDTWQKFAASQRLPIEFNVVDRFAPGAGAGTGFEDWATRASHFVTTSVSEGFGMTFLEAIARGKPLIARNLPHLTAEHERHGIHTGRLYDRLLIPIDWIGLPILYDYLVTDLERTYRAYRRPLPNETVDAALDAIQHDGWLDFGNLPEPLQQAVIERIGEPGQRHIPLVEIAGKMESAADWLAAAIANRTPTANPDQLAPYSADAYLAAITGLYSDLALQPAGPVTYLPADEILTAHLAPESFHFLLSALKPSTAPPKSYRAVIFDIYGTLLIAPSGGVKPDPAADALLRDILREFGHVPPESPSAELHAAVLRHHAASGEEFPEIDLRVLWREILSLDPGADTTELVEATEAAWHPATAMPGAEAFIQRLARSFISLGLLSNAQSNTLASLGPVSDLFAQELTLLSYQHGIAKPAPALFEILTDRLAGRGITPGETLFIGNDPLIDIVPAAAAGFRTALFTVHPDSLRPGDCKPDLTFTAWQELHALF